MSAHVRKFNVGDRVRNWISPAHSADVGQILAVFSGGRVRVRWPDGEMRTRAVGTLRRVDDELARLVAAQATDAGGGR